MECKSLDETLREREGVITDEELFHLMMVALDRKPGGLVMDPDVEAVNKLMQGMEEIGIDNRLMGGREKGLLHRLLRRDRSLDSQGFFYTRESSRFRILEESDGRFYGCSSDAVGEFLGYPEKSVIYYSESRKMGMDTVRKIREGFDESDLRFLALVGYIPSPDRQQVEKAVKKGRERSELIEEKGEEGLSIGPELRDRLIEESHWT